MRGMLNTRSRRYRGLGRGLRRGLSLFGALLALALLGLMVLAAARFFEARMADERARLAGRQLTVLSHAAASHVNSRFPELLAAARDGPVELTHAQLRAEGSLPAGFPELDALGRGHRVLILGPGAGVLDLLVIETVEEGDTAYPAARALATLRRFDHASVYGDHLYRIAVPGFAAANRMETDLDLGGHGLANAGAIEAKSLTLENDFAVGGALDVTRDLVVGRAIRVSGAAEIAGGMSAASARISGAASSGALRVRDTARAASLTARGAVNAGSIGASGAIAAGSANLTSLQSRRVTTREIAAGGVAASGVTARLVRANERIDGAQAGFSRLTVGTCTGC